MKNLDELKDYCLETRIVSFVQHICDFIQRLWCYIPYIWKDGDYDFETCLPFIVFKLKRLEKNFKKDKWYLNSPKYAKQIRIVLNHLDRWQNADKHALDYCLDRDDDIKFENGTIVLSPRRKVIIRQFNRIYEENRQQFWYYLTKWCSHWSL